MSEGRACPADTISLTGAEAILRVLKGAGVSEIFGLAGGKLSALYRALGRATEFRYTGVRHEAAAGFMATSVYAATGRVAVCLGETGPGGLNLMTGLAGASANHLAVLAITSSNPSGIMAPARGAFSSTDNEKVFGAMTKWSVSVRDPQRIPEILHRALRTALSDRPGPVHVDIAADALCEKYDYALGELDALPSTYRSVSLPVPGATELMAAAELLAGARRPVLIAGGGVVRASGADAFRQLTDRLGAPAMTTQMGLGVIPTDSPAFIGQGGFVGGPAVLRALREGDLLLAVGCRFSSFMWTDGPPRWTDAPARKLIHIDIDPQMLGQNVPLTLGLQGDARRTLEGLIEELGSHQGSCDHRWTASLAAEYRQHIDELVLSGAANSREMHPAALARAVGEFVRPEDFVTFDGGHTSFWSNSLTPAAQPATRFNEPGMAHLGFGLPAAIALARCFPERRSYCITGDGAFGFTLQELDTARRYQANVITIIHNNQAWGVIRAGQLASGFELGTELSGTDYAAVARAFGCHGERIDRAEEIEPALGRAVQSRLPAVIDARVGFVPHPMLSTFGASTVPQ